MAVVEFLLVKVWFYPFGPGLTSNFASVRTTVNLTSYKELPVFNSYKTVIYDTPYYLVEYEKMKVIFCVNTCGVNGFNYTMLWKQY